MTLAAQSVWTKTAAAVPAFGTQDESLSALQAIGTPAHFSRDETIFCDGDEARYAYKVMSGTVRLCKVMSDGRRQIAGFLHAGDFFGLEWLDTYSFSAEALDNVVVARFAKSRLDRLREERRDVQSRIMTLISRDLSAAQNHLVLLGRQTAKERVASFLLTWAARKNVKDGGTLELPMGRQDIADHLGLTIETVCRAVTELKRARFISVPNRTEIVLHNLSALRKIAGKDA